MSQYNIKMPTVVSPTTINFPASSGTLALESSGGGGGIAGTNYIYVAADGTDTENATELQAAYNTAKTLSPSSTNRITVVAGPGKYNFGSSTFTMDTEYIDLVSLDGNPSVLFNSSDAGSYPYTTSKGGTIFVNANNVTVVGVDTESKPFLVGNDLSTHIENCRGGNRSFSAVTESGDAITNGTFVNCRTDSFSAGFAVLPGAYDPENPTTNYARGTFIDCHTGFGFGNIMGEGVADGRFIDCFAAGGFGGTAASGYFLRCSAEGSAFAFSYSLSEASGTFIHCTAGGSQSFGEIASGNFRYCHAGPQSFGYNGSRGYGTASGNFHNCTAQAGSFGGSGSIFPGEATGQFVECLAGDSSYGTGGLASGVFIHCIGGDGSFGPKNASGVFTGCVAGVASFGADTEGVLTGKLKHCTLTSGTYQTPTSTGKIVLCIDGSDNIINATA